uniref:Carboxylic ester hydrolase n=1 Tax=Antheraea polyphemus TaxID=7120 RepID=Q76LV8_ANTPO|nr:putative pheromone-degrading enzyme [Antheraea polyphemus]
MFYKLLFCLCIVAAHAGEQDTSKTADEVPIATSQSGVFRGSWMTTRRGRRFQAYRGIRYAEPPVGELRFQPPKPILYYKDVVDASKEGPACPLPVPDDYYVDEDCLAINVYTPNNKVKKPLPVIMYIHPGAFYAFTGRSDVAGPGYLLDRDIVFVAFNYRLATLGFMSTGDKLAPGNNGMKDQVMAMRWIQRNIAAFGGDPNSVTLAGYSAGSISVMLHMISPMSKGLFHRGISMSASPINKEPLPNNFQSLAVKQAQIVNCSTASNQAIVDCLKTISWKVLGDSLPQFFVGGDPIGLWGPVVENDFGQERFLDIQPLDAIRQGRFHSVPHIISQTKYEFFYQVFELFKNDTLITRMNDDWETAARVSFLLPEKNIRAAANKLKEVYLEGKPVAKDNRTIQGVGGLYRDSITSLGVHRMANLMCRHSKHPVYYYEFSYFGDNSHYEDPVTGKPFGAVHHDDLIYLLTMSYRFPVIETTSPHSYVIDEMTALWYNFARYDDPNPRGDTPELNSLVWPVMKPDDRKYLRIGNKLTVHKNMFEDRYKVWDELYPIQY